MRKVLSFVLFTALTLFIFAFAQSTGDAITGGGLTSGMFDMTGGSY